MSTAYKTDTGVAVLAVTAAQMREVDRVAMNETGPNLYQMMENAGRSLASAALEMLGEQWNEARIVVLAGTGGNGGGGICAARHLANRGARVALCLTARERLRGVPAWQYQVFRSTGGQELRPQEMANERADLVLDALIGYSLDGAPMGVYADLIGWANDGKAPVLSLDVPSGVNATTAETCGASVRAQTTMTLALPKTGLVAEQTGRLLLADIGIPAETYRRAGIDCLSPFDTRYILPLHLQPREAA
jgi:NAD(P)H-hydrate epimerase